MSQPGLHWSSRHKGAPLSNNLMLTFVSLKIGFWRQWKRAAQSTKTHQVENYTQVGIDRKGFQEQSGSLAVLETEVREGQVKSERRSKYAYDGLSCFLHISMT